MSDKPSQILVPVSDLPPMPLVLADAAFIDGLRVTAEKVKTLAITDAASLADAGAVLNDLTTAGTALEKARVKVKQPFLVICQQIDACAKAPMERVEELKREVKRGMGRYAAWEKETADEAERVRQAEIKKLEAAKAAEDAAAKAKADAIAAEAKAKAALAAPEDLDFADEAPPAPPPAPKTETELKLEALKFAPVVKPAPAPTGIRFTVRLIAAVEDLAKVPEAFVIRTANEQLIKATYCTGWKEGDAIPFLPGVKFTVDRTAASTGKHNLNLELT